MKGMVFWSSVILILSGCSAYPAAKNYPTQREVYSAERATEVEVQKIIEATDRNISEPGSLTFSNIYTVRRKDGNSEFGRIGCALVRNENWAQGDFKNVHFINGKVSFLSGNYLRFACNPTKYEAGPGFSMTNGIEVKDADRLGGSPKSEVNDSAEEATSAVRERVTPSQNDIEHAQDVIKEKLKDPESA